MPVAHIVVDYQNVHLTAHDQFCPASDPVHLCLIHPLSYAHEVLKQRNLIRRLLAEKNREEFEPAELGTVRSFRGLPSNRHEPQGYRRAQAQQSEWTRQPKSIVRYRPLKYRHVHGTRTAQEKGIES